jgi:hypothetical protein
MYQRSQYQVVSTILWALALDFVVCEPAKWIITRFVHKKIHLRYQIGLPLTEADLAPRRYPRGPNGRFYDYEESVGAQNPIHYYNDIFGDEATIVEIESTVDGRSSHAAPRHPQARDQRFDNPFDDLSEVGSTVDDADDYMTVVKSQATRGPRSQYAETVMSDGAFWDGAPEVAFSEIRTDAGRTDAFETVRDSRSPLELQDDYTEVASAAPSDPRVVSSSGNSPVVAVPLADQALSEVSSQASDRAESIEQFDSVRDNLSEVGSSQVDSDVEEVYETGSVQSSVDSIAPTARPSTSAAGQRNQRAFSYDE